MDQPAKFAVYCPGDLVVIAVDYSAPGHPRNVHEDGSLCDHPGGVRIGDKPERAFLGSAIVRVADHGQFFATRASARKIIAERLEAIPSHEPVILEWAGVEVVTNAFASELAAWLLGTDRRIGNQNMNDEVRETYEKALRRLEAG